MCHRVVTLCLCGRSGCGLGVCGVCVGGSCGVCAGAPESLTLTGVFRECGACACVTVAHVTCATRARPPRESVRSLPCRLCEEGESRAESFSRRERATLDAPDSDGGEIGDFCHPGRNRRLSGGAKIGDFCHFGKSATFVPGGKRGPAAILINAYSGDFCHPVLSNAVAPEPLVYHSGTKCAILGHFRAPPPFLAILGHFGPFWAFLALFGPFWPPRPPPAPIFGPEFPRTSPKTSPRTSAMRKISAHIPEEKIFPPHTRAQCRRTSPTQLGAQILPDANSAQNLPAHFCAQIRRTNSAQILPPHICAQIPRTQILRKRLRRKIEQRKKIIMYRCKNIFIN